MVRRNPLVSSVPVPDGLDWGRHMVLVAASGRRVGEGFSIRIELVEKSDTEVVVHVTESGRSALGQAHEGAARHPTDAVVVPAIDLPVRFVVNGRTERVVKPTASRPARSYVSRDMILRHFTLTADERAHLEAAYGTYAAARRATAQWLGEQAARDDVRQEYARRVAADRRAFDAAIHRVLGEARYATYVNARALQAAWRARRKRLADLVRNPKATENEKRAYLEQVRLLDAQLKSDFDRLFKPASTQPAGTTHAP